MTIKHLKKLILFYLVAFVIASIILYFLFLYQCNVDVHGWDGIAEWCVR